MYRMAITRIRMSGPQPLKPARRAAITPPIRKALACAQTCRNIPRVKTCLKRRDALRGGAVRERLRADSSARHPLEPVIAHSSRRAHAVLHIGLIDDTALLGRVAPHAR